MLHFRLSVYYCNIFILNDPSTAVLRTYAQDERRGGKLKFKSHVLLLLLTLIIAYLFDPCQDFSRTVVHLRGNDTECKITSRFERGPIITRLAVPPF